MATDTGAVIVTGAGGFVGRALKARLGARQIALHLSRANWMEEAASVPFEGATVIHLAARVHEPNGDEALFMRDNVEKTRELARLARVRGARRLVFLSSIKVNGEETQGPPFRAGDPGAPEDAYARSKQHAEAALHEVSAGSPMEAVVIRAPLVYGRGARGNLSALLRLADTPLPLPFAAISNRRSFIHVEDLAAALDAGSRIPRAAGRTYLVAHRQPLSTPALVGGLRRALGRPERLFGVAPALLEAAAAAVGRGAQMRRLTRSLEIDASLAETELEWTARRTPADALADLAAGCREVLTP